MLLLEAKMIFLILSQRQNLTISLLSRPWALGLRPSLCAVLMSEGEISIFSLSFIICMAVLLQNYTVEAEGEDGPVRITVSRRS